MADTEEEAVSSSSADHLTQVLSVVRVDDPDSALQYAAKAVIAATEAAAVASRLSGDAVSAAAALDMSAPPLSSLQSPPQSMLPLSSASPSIRVISLENFRSMGEFPRYPDHAHLTQVCPRLSALLNRRKRDAPSGHLHRRSILGFFHLSQSLLDRRHAIFLSSTPLPLAHYFNNRLRRCRRLARPASSRQPAEPEARARGAGRRDSVEDTGAPDGTGEL